MKGANTELLIFLTWAIVMYFVIIVEQNRNMVCSMSCVSVYSRLERPWAVVWFLRYFHTFMQYYDHLHKWKNCGFSFIVLNEMGSVEASAKIPCYSSLASGLISTLQRHSP